MLSPRVAVRIFSGALKAIYLNDTSGYPYPASLGPYSKYWWAAMRVGTDAVPGLGHCAVRWFARQLLAGGSPPAGVLWSLRSTHWKTGSSKTLFGKKTDGRS